MSTQPDPDYKPRHDEEGPWFTSAYSEREAIAIIAQERDLPRHWRLFAIEAKSTGGDAKKRYKVTRR